MRLLPTWLVNLFAGEALRRPGTPAHELAQECERLREEVRRLTWERDCYLKSLYALAPKDVTFTEDDLQAMDGTTQTLMELIRRLEQDSMKAR